MDHISDPAIAKLTPDRLRRYNDMSDESLRHARSFMGRNGPVAEQDILGPAIDAILAAREHGVIYDPDGGIMHHPV